MTNRDGPLILEQFLPYRLSVLANRVSRDLSRLYAKEFGLSIPQWRVLAILGFTPGLSADQVCQRSEMDKVAVSRAVSRLVNKKLISRRIDPDDRRKSMLRLTAGGTKIYRRIVPLAQAYEQEILSALSQKTRSGLSELLAELDHVTVNDRIV